MDVQGLLNMKGLTLGASYKQSKATSFCFEYSRFGLYAANDAWYGVNGAVIRPGAAGSSSDLGTEFDLEITWTISEHFQTSFGAAHFADGEFVRDTGDSGDTNWLYFRFLVTF